MRKIQNIAFVLLATLFASCINDHIEPTFCRDAELAISVSTSSAGTRVQGDNDDMPTAESIVKDLQYFLYVKGSGEDAAPIYAGTITDITDNDDIDNDSPRPDTPADEDDNFSKTVQIPASALNALFPNGATECEIYVLANYLDNTMDAEHFDGIDLTKDLANATRRKLKAIELNTTFYELVGDFEMTPTSFVMDSEGTDIVRRGTGNNINTLTSGTIYLTRAAAKVMIEVNVQNAIDVSGNTWEPITQITDPTARKMFISFYNGVTTGVIDDGSDVAGSTAVPTVTDKDAYYKVENVQLQSGKIATDGATGDTSAVTRAGESTSWVSAVDFYSYANSWTAGDEEHEPYFEISIPWRKKAAGQDDSANWVTYNYTVPIAMNNNRFDRNKLYLIRLNVGALGDLSTLESYKYSYIVLNWDEVTVDATLTRPKYFVVEKDYVEMNNVTSFSVPYTSSDAVSAKIISVSRDNVKNRIVEEDIRDIAESTNTENGWNDFNNQDFSVSTEGGVVTLTHKLDNDRNSDYFDYVPYEIIVEVVNESGFVERITFVQYPAMYVEADANTDYQQNTNHDETWQDSWNDNHGYQWVNGYRGSSYNQSGNGNNRYHYMTVNNTRVQYLASSNGLSDNASNQNPNMYTITVSSFSDGSYLVGDPRTTHYDETLKDAMLGNSNYYVFASAPALSGTSPRRLQYYYPTDDSDNTINVISPKFRVASSYSVLSSAYLTSREVARRRCASYQEDGYPAGRWRMATAAEMQFMIQLSQQGLIPALFSSNTNYWCAHGVINYVTGATTATLIKGTSNSSGGSIRCVYDEWYWGSDKAIESNADAKFTWGDMLRPGDSAN